VGACVSFNMGSEVLLLKVHNMLIAIVLLQRSKPYEKQRELVKRIAQELQNDIKIRHLKEKEKN
jgi:hypothetical protein